MTPLPPLRVERALRLLPDVDALAPLRASLIAASRQHGMGEAHLTVGKRVLEAADLDAVAPRALRRVTAHLTALYEAAIAAIRAEEFGDLDGAVQALLGAGDGEARVGREAAARAWFEHALALAEGDRDRRPEIDVLQRLGALEAARGELDRAARILQRGFVLAEAEGDAKRAAEAALGLGEIALERNNVRGASAWFARGFEHATGTQVLLGRLALGMSALALLNDSVDDADRWARRAAEEFDTATVSTHAVDLLAARARVSDRRDRPLEALALFREALVLLPGLGGDPRRELALHVEVSRRFVSMDRLPAAEDEIRRAEEIAIAHNLGHELARVYLLLGDLRGRQRDESGFVFFEKAIELSRAGEPSPRLEAAAYVSYAQFRAAFGESEDLRAYLERAREILELSGDPQLERTIELLLNGHAHA